mmetsp:Transcript_1057/g.2588  ORF Transcript_1057/g.2588 Transcript_1057/m.2588 type:complete len:296 (-) Transcript_1057:174-1061(-)
MTESQETMLITAFMALRDLDAVKNTLQHSHIRVKDKWPELVFGEWEDCNVAGHIEQLVSSLLDLTCSLRAEVELLGGENKKLKVELSKAKAKQAESLTSGTVTPRKTIVSRQSGSYLPYFSPGSYCETLTVPKVRSHSRARSIGTSPLNIFNQVQSLEISAKLADFARESLERPSVQEDNCLDSEDESEWSQANEEEGLAFFIKLAESQFKEQIDNLKLENEQLRSKLQIEERDFPTEQEFHREYDHEPCEVIEEVSPFVADSRLKLLKKILRQAMARERRRLMHSFINLKYWGN